MSDYHRVYMKLVDLLERGHVVQFEKRHRGYEVTVFETPFGTQVDHVHVDDELVSEAMDRAHSTAVARWPKEDD